MKPPPLGPTDQSSGGEGLVGGRASSGAGDRTAEFAQVSRRLLATESPDAIQWKIIQATRAMPSVKWAELVTVRPDGTLACSLASDCACRSLDSAPLREGISQARQSAALVQVVLPGEEETVLVLPLVAAGEVGDVLVLALQPEAPPDRASVNHFTSFAGLAGQALGIWRHDQGLLRDHRTLEAAIGQRSQDLERQREFDRVLLENLSTGVVACDEKGQLVLFNKTLREWHGIGPSDAPMDEWSSRYKLYEAGGTVPLAMDRIPLVRAFHGEEVRSQSFVIKSAEGEARLVVANGGQLRAADGRLLGAVVTMEDITQETKAQQEVREANVRLRELLQRTEELARKAELANEAKSQFLATMSHELRTPMSGVLGMTDILAMTKLDEEQRSCLELIRSSGESLLALINGILDFSKIEAGQLELEFHDFELLPLVRKLTDTYAATAAAKGLRLDLRCDESLPPWLHADSGRLQQVLVNLLNNAVKFTEEGGITLSVTCCSETPDWVSLRFAVRDTGIGIPADKRDLLFRRFSQLDASSTRKYGGTGLGLAICKQLVELFGGSIGVISPPPGPPGGEEDPLGSEFWFEVRLAKGRAGPKTSASAHRPFTQRHRVLVVEDNPVNRRMIVSMLQKLGLEAEWAENGQEALDRLNRAQFDLILMDLQMPVMGGEQAARRIRALPEGHPARGVPIIAVSAHAFPEDKLRCLQAGMNDHVTKPIQLDKLEEVLRHWLERPLVASAA